MSEILAGDELLRCRGCSPTHHEQLVAKDSADELTSTLLERMRTMDCMTARLEALLFRAMGFSEH
jgi:hypothetical protein